MRNRIGIGLIALILLAVMPALAQTNNGIISGRVTDQTGAVVPSATITVTQTETNVDAASQTNSEGLFRVPSLIPGPYKVTVVAAGFKKQVRDSLTLRIGDNLNVEIKLDVGAVTESVEVTGELPLLDTQTSASGQVMQGEYFYKLPNYQHWSKGVLYYTPQVQTSNAPWPGSLGNWNFNGGQSYQTAQYEDGIIATSMDGGTSLNNPEVGIEEVKVISSAMPAEFGHATSGALIFVKKGGTNQIHGEGGYLFKSTPMMHRRFFQRTTLQQDAATNSTLFQMPDFVISGPVYIPKIYNGKNKTFFQVAGSYHIDSSSNSGNYHTPTAEMLAGNFSAYSNQIYDPNSTSGSFAAGNLLRTAFPGNQIPTNRFSTMWQRIAANNPFKAPMAGVGSATNTGPNGNIVQSGTGNYFNLTNQFRVDHSFTDRFRMMLSYSMGNQHQPQNNVNIVYTPYDQYQTLNYTLQSHAALSFSYTISPTLISETKVGMYRRTANGRARVGEDYTFEMAKTVPNLPANVYLNPISLGFPTQGPNGSNQLGVGTMSVNVNNSHQLNQDFTKVWKTHAFKFGYEWLWQNYIQHNIAGPRLSLTFGGTNGLQGNGTSIANTGGITFADIMLGYVYSYSYAQQGAANLPEVSNHSFYFQDDWRVRPNLTLNLGVRYSNETPAHSKFPGGLSVGSLDVADNYYTSGSIPGVLTCPAGGCKGGWIHPKGFLWNRDNNNFRPRLGLAWTINESTVIRSGFGINTLDWNLYTNQSEIGGGSFFNQSVSNAANVYTPLFSINQGVPAFVSVPQLPDGSIPTSASTPSGRPTITVIPANYHNPYVLNWNFIVQRAIKKDYLLEVSYVGMHNVGFSGNYNWQSRPYGTGLAADGSVIDLTKPENWAYRSTWVNNSSGAGGTQGYKPYPNLNGVNYQCNCVSMIYHSGTVKLEKRYSHGLSFLTFLTLQKGIQNSPGNLYQDQNLMRSVTGQTQKYRYVSSMTYELPMGKGQKWINHSRLWDAIFGGYSFSWNFSIWAPTPMGLGYSGGTYLNPVTGSVSGTRQDYPGYEATISSSYLVQIPQLRDNWQDIGNDRFTQAKQNPIVTNCGTTPILQPNGATWGNNCLVVAPSFARGNIPNNFWIEQRIIGANASIYKDFPIKEKVKAQLRMDYYNPFKWFNWGTAQTTMTQTNPAIFMTPGLSDFGDSTEGGPSQIHISFRVKF